MDTQTRLRSFAVDRCLPYLMTRPNLAPYRNDLSLVLVGSVATGLCDEASDVDIAIVCDKDIYDIISKGTPWGKGRPTEVHLCGIQLHYYAIAYGEILTRLAELDDVYMHVYSNVLALWDPKNQYATRLGALLGHNPEVRRQRLEGKLDMLIRRSRALRASLATGDIMSVGRLCLETLTRCLETTALLDDTSFDPRKRLFVTAVRGHLGAQLEPEFRLLLSTIGDLGQISHAAALDNFAFPDRLDSVVSILSDAAKEQGFRVGLDTPDRRQM